MKNIKEITKRIIKDYGYIPLTIVLTYLVFGLMFRPAVIPTASMEPTVTAGSFSLVCRLSRPERLKRGDIVAFYSHEGVIYVKRVIGLAGETIEIKDGSVYVDGEKLDEAAYLPAGVTTEAGSYEKYCVPTGCLFFLGDNRQNSYDARYWEFPFIAYEKVYGKVLFTIKIPFFSEEMHILMPDYASAQFELRKNLMAEAFAARVRLRIMLTDDGVAESDNKEVACDALPTARRTGNEHD